jgi:hypothetical protein
MSKVNDRTVWGCVRAGSRKPKCAGPVKPRYYIDGGRFKSEVACDAHFKALLDEVERERRTGAKAE